VLRIWLTLRWSRCGSAKSGGSSSPSHPISPGIGVEEPSDLAKRRRPEEAGGVAGRRSGRSSRLLLFRVVVRRPRIKFASKDAAGWHFWPTAPRCLFPSARKSGQTAEHRVEQRAKGRALVDAGENCAGLLFENSMTDFGRCTFQ